MIGWLRDFMVRRRWRRIEPIPEAHGVPSGVTFPKLVEAVDHPLGGELVLSDGSRLVIDVSPSWLAKALAWTGLPPDPNPASVFHNPVGFGGVEWNRLVQVVINSPSAGQVLRRFPGLRWQLELSYKDIVSLPFRVYGGSSQHQIYLTHPVGFGPSEPPSAETLPKEGWYYALLSQPGGHIFWTWVHVRTGTVRIEHACRPGHFVEEGCLPPRLTPPAA